MGAPITDEIGTDKPSQPRTRVRCSAGNQHERKNIAPGKNPASRRPSATIPRAMRAEPWVAPPTSTLRRHVERLETSAAARFAASDGRTKLRCFTELYEQIVPRRNRQLVS